VIGIASWYGPQFHRRQTANGEWFDMDYLTAAHTTLPLPSYVRVTNLENGRELVVRVNDRGPFVGDRIIDLSRKAADILRMKNKGTARVRVKYIGPAPLNDDGTDLSAMNDASKNGPLMTEQPRAPSQASLLADASLVTGSLPVSSAPDGYAIQIGCFADQANAERTRSRVGSIGPVEVSRMFANSGTLFRVRIGPLTDLDQAKEALHQVIGAGYPDAQLMSWDGTL
jgi:rare lipoprotein A